MIGITKIGRLGIARWTLGVLLALGIVATRLPLLDVPGYELSEVLAMAVGLFGLPLGIAAARTPFGRQWPARAALAAGAFSAVSALAAVAVVGVAARAGSRCSPLAGLPFVWLLPLPTAFLSTAAGAACGRAFRRRLFAGLAAAAVVLAGLAFTLWPLYFGPQVFALDHLLGYFPGPLYDERLSPTAALYAYRGLTVLCAAALLASLWAMEARRPGRRILAAFVLWAGFSTGVALEHHFGAAVSTADIDRVLGGLLDGRGVTLHYPRELSPSAVEELRRAAERSAAEVARALGVVPGAPIDVFFYRSAGEKGRLTGASATHFTKPWLRQIHTLAGGEGRRVLRHELVHALAAPLGRPPFGACARLLGLAVQPGIIEGLAMAIDWPADELTLHQWSRAMREAGLAPDIRAIVDPAGFAAASEGRAYTLAGSFLRFLLDREGAARMRVLYRDGDFVAAYGRPLDALAAEWEAFVDRVPLDPRARGAAQDRFRQGSIFARPCAREMASLTAGANAAGAAGNPGRQAALLERCLALAPGDPALLEALWNAQRAAFDREGAAATLARLLASPALDPLAAARVALARGDDAWKAGDAAAARAAWGQVLGAGIDRSTRRAVEIRERALGDARASPAVRAYFADPDNPGGLVALEELRCDDPAFPEAAYLVGLRLAQQGRRREGVEALHAALAAGVGEDLQAKALRTAASAEIDLGDFPAAGGDLSALGKLHRSPAEDILRADLASRLTFERVTYGRGLPGVE